MPMNDDAMRKARSALIVSQPFFGSLALYLDLEAGQTQTMATDGKKLYYNPAWVEGLPGKQRQGVIAHEVLHCAYKHHLRRQHRDPQLWNIATDYAINRDLLEAGFELPKGGLFSTAYKGMNAEEIYTRLQSAEAKKPQPKPGKGKPEAGQGQGKGNDASQAGVGGASQGQSQPGDGQGQPSQGDGAGKAAKGNPGQGWGEVRDGTAQAGESAANAASEAEWDRRVREALAVSARGIGGQPGALAELLKDINKPRVNWRDQLRAFVDARSTVDFTWKRPSRRSAGAGFFMPGSQPDSLGKLGIVLDVSGSVDTKLLKQFLGELQSILDNRVCEELIVIQCDTRVTDIAEYRSGDYINMEVKGRGGTKFSPALEWFAEHHPDTGALIYFTDLECSDYGQEPECPMLWAAYGLESQLAPWIEKVPFGQVIKVIA
jgi:predicted metal-dependent peptidase